MIDKTMRDSNTQTDTYSGVSQELEDRIMQVLPRPLADWLRYEAHSDFCVKSIFQEWRAGVSVDQLLAGLRGVKRQDTRRIYGAMHPQASFI